MKHRRGLKHLRKLFNTQRRLLHMSPQPRSRLRSSKTVLYLVIWLIGLLEMQNSSSKEDLNEEHYHRVDTLGVVHAARTRRHAISWRGTASYFLYYAVAELCARAVRHLDI